MVVFYAASTAVRSLRKGGAPGLLSSTLGSGDLALDGVYLHPPASQFLPGSDTVLTDSLSRPHHLTHPEWSLHMTVFLFLRRLCRFNCFLCHLGHSSWFDLLLLSGSVVGRHGRVSPVLGPPSGLRVPSGGCHPRIIAELRASTGTGLTLVTLHWAKRP